MHGLCLMYFVHRRVRHSSLQPQGQRRSSRVHISCWGVFWGIVGNFGKGLGFEVLTSTRSFYKRGK